ncbi:probable F-box protein At5g04010 [Rhododendron vialii]|uniref:probable F-box protein At5g04010 n=1 Tax=Rhododendron vialii TaxID=182163 RepID=UPI00265E73FF|nr:probable F-box protein At5g04010 [Rhododendron vialii]
MSMRKRPSGTSQPPPCPWEVLVLVATHLDPKNLALSSCVSKSWSVSMSSDHLWEPIVSTHFPSLSSLHRSPSPSVAVPFRRLYTLGRASADRRLRKPPKPTLCLGNLVFSVSVHDGSSRVFTAVKPVSELGFDPNYGVFRFDIDIDMCGGDSVVVDGLRVTWNVVLEGYKGVFTMMDCCKGKGGFVVGSDGWFTEELPPPGGCCSGGGGTGSGLVADLRLRLRGVEGGGGGKVVVEKVGVGMMNVMCWRYSSVDDALRYLQHFLMPSDM